MPWWPEGRPTGKGILENVLKTAPTDVLHPDMSHSLTFITLEVANMKISSSSNSGGSASQEDDVTQGSPSPAFSEPSTVDPVEAEIRNRMVAEAAYYRAEARGFADGYELEDWLDAEAEIDLTIPLSALGPLQD